MGGRVPLSVFYSQPQTDFYSFAESKDYLRKIGALDELTGGAPQVRIANYVLGPANCVGSSSYYSVCCLNECESLMSELESKVQAPTVTPEQLEQVVSSLSSSTVEAPRHLSESLSQKLRLIAERHEGVVPIHGRLFTQWLHFAFPNECPYPQQYSAELLKPGKAVTDSMLASPEEKTMHIEIGNTTEFAEPSMSQWSDEEILIFVEPESHWFKKICKHVSANHRTLCFALGCMAQNSVGDVRSLWTRGI